MVKLFELIFGIAALGGIIRLIDVLDGVMF